MIHLLIEPLPETVEVGGRELPVLTDFREWLRFAALMQDRSLPGWEKLILLRGWFLEPPKAVTKDMVMALREFYEAKALEPDPLREEEDKEPAPLRPPTFDWEVDAGCVLADFRRFYGLDLLRVEYLHWWEFRALFSALPPDGSVKERIRIRGWDLSKERNPERRSAIRREQARIALPFHVDENAIAAVFAAI